MFHRNEDVQKAKGRIPYFAIAEKIGVHENTIYRWLRSELSPDKKKQILRAIDEIKKELKEIH